MSLILTHPATAYRSCEDCQRWIYDVQSGQIKRNKLTGEPIPRPPGTKMPCVHCPRCEGEAEKTPEVGKRRSWSARNWRTWELYWRQQGTGSRVGDAIVRRNFGIIAEALAQYDRACRRAGVKGL